jgi:hypothetical protein
VKYFFKLFFFFCILFELNADDGVELPPIKAIIIEHYGSSNRPLDKLNINTRYDGYLHDDDWITYYFRASESFFAEIMELINRNKELFDKNRLSYEYGCFQLYIEHEDEMYYLNGREKSFVFFVQLSDLVNTKHNYGTFKSVLKQMVNLLTP